MKLNFLILFVILNISTSSYSSETNSNVIQLPNAKTLRIRLEEANFTHFVEKTAIVTQLADKTLTSHKVLMTINCLFFDYLEKIKDPTLASTMEKRRLELFKIVFNDHPKALEELSLSRFH